MKNLKRIMGVLLTFVLVINSFGGLANASAVTVKFDRQEALDINNVTFKSQLTGQFLYAQDKWDTSIGLTSNPKHIRNRWNIEVHGEVTLKNTFGQIVDVPLYKIKNTTTDKYITVRDMKNGGELKQTKDLGKNTSQLFIVGGTLNPVGNYTTISSFDNEFLVTTSSRRLVKFQNNPEYATTENIFTVAKQ